MSSMKINEKNLDKALNLQEPGIESSTIQVLRNEYRKYLTSNSEGERKRIHELIAEECVKILELLPDSSSITRVFSGLVDEISEIKTQDSEHAIALLSQKYPDPLEAILATAKNFEIAKKNLRNHPLVC